MLVESDMTTAGEVRQVEAMGINGEQLGRRFWRRIHFVPSVGLSPSMFTI
jgi:hypothetical protein